VVFFDIHIRPTAVILATFKTISVALVTNTGAHPTQLLKNMPPKLQAQIVGLKTREWSLTAEQLLQPHVGIY
jgi:hypothetical protein